MNQALKKILIKSKKEVYSAISGNNITRSKGEGYDFCELKEYEIGEDVKNIDWVISAKMQKPYVKVYHSQKEQNIKIVSLLNGSVFFGTHKFKQEVITELVSAIGFICVSQGDPFTSYIANENLEVCTKKSKKTFSVNKMTEDVYSYDVLNKKIEYKKILNDLYKSIKHKSLIFLIGDFFDIKDLDLKLLSHKHEVIVLIVRDKFEEEPIEMGNVNFNDPSTNENFQGNLNKTTINSYAKNVQENDQHLYKHLQNCSIKFTKIYSHEDVIKKLIGLFRK